MSAAIPNCDVWAIVRCYNEAPVARGVIAALCNEFANVVAVDDGSTDDSYRELTRSGAHVVRHAVNLGAGAALQTGLAYALIDADARYFISFDADGQHRVRDAVAMIERLREGVEDVLIGSRFLGAVTGISPGRRRVLRTARLFERAVSGAKLSDAHNGLRAFSRRFAQVVDLKSTDMAYASELLRLVVRSGLPYAEFPVTIDYTDYSRTKGQRSANSVNIAVDILLGGLLRGVHR